MRTSTLYTSIACLGVVLATCCGCGAAAGGSDEEIVRLERAALDRWGKGDPRGFLDLYAADVTYFDPTRDKRIDGLDAMKALLAPASGKIRIDRYEMLNAKVQRYGDVAVLTYNLIDYVRRPDGSERPLPPWNSTSVFRHADGRWRTVHSHWSLTKPDLKQPIAD